MSYTWEELLNNTGLSPETLAGQLGNLVKAKVLLVKDSASVGSSGSIYELNTGFKSKKIRINLNMAVKSETKAESEETHKTVEEDRKLLIQVLDFIKLSGCYCSNNENEKNFKTCGSDAGSHHTTSVTL
jgi:hypothetical protein